MLVFSFNVLFLFFFSFYIFILESRVKVRVTSQSHCHTSVTSDDMVTVMITQSYGHIEYNRRFKNNDII